MNQDLIVGLLALGVPLFAVGYLMLRRNTGIFRMFLAMLLIGLGYLTATGALTDIGRQIMGSAAIVAPVEVPAATTAPAVETPAPAPAAETPAPAESAPAEDAAGEPPPEEAATPADDAPPSEGEPAPPPAPANP